MSEAQGQLFAFARATQLSAEQRHALESTEKETLVVAGAGSGKTRLLIERLLWALTHGEDGAIVALTFSERAAEELQERAAALAVALTARERQSFARRVRVATIDGYCRALLLEHPLAADWPGDRLLPTDDLRAFLRLRSFELVRDYADLDALGLELAELPEALEALLTLLRLRPEGALPRTSIDTLITNVRSEVVGALNACLVTLRGERSVELGGIAPLVCDQTGFARAPEQLVDLLSAVHRKRLGPEAGRARTRLQTLAKRAEGLFERRHLGRAEAFAAFLALAEQVLARYQEWKRAHQAFDFPDLTHAAITLLARPDVGDAVIDNLAHLLIDEAQDTNALQEQLLARLGERALVFRVGDPRQAIYGFRDADVDGFLDKRRRLPAAASLALTVNHRSRAPILALANDFWRATEAAADALAALSAARGGDGALLPTLYAVHQAEHDERPQLAAEAGFVATLAGAVREGAAPGDVAVLCRTTVQAQQVFAALEARGVAAFLRAKRELSSLPIHHDAVAILTALDQPDWDHAVLGAMRSGPWGASTAEILALARRARGLPLLSALEDAPLSARAARGRDAFLALLSAGRGRPRAELLARFLRLAGCGGALPSFAPIFTVLHESEGLGLSLDEVTARLSFASIEETAGHEDGVQVMTIHAAKGLEWGTVLVPFAARRFESQAPRGELLSLPSGAASLRGPWPADEVAAALDWETRRRARAEELRLYYVALTRAKDRLFITGAPGEKQIAGEPGEQASLVDMLRSIYAVPAPVPGECFVGRADTSALVLMGAGSEDAPSLVSTPWDQVSRAASLED